MILIFNPPLFFQQKIVQMSKITCNCFLYEVIERFSVRQIAKVDHGSNNNLPVLRARLRPARPGGGCTIRYNIVLRECNDPLDMYLKKTKKHEPKQMHNRLLYFSFKLNLLLN